MSIGKKRLAQSCHKLVVLSELYLDNLAEIKPLIDLDPELAVACALVSRKCEELLTNVFEAEELRKSTYIQDLTNKVDSCIRQNFVPVTGKKI